VAAALTLEDGRIAASEAGLRRVWQDGVRILTLTWNQENAFGFPHRAAAGLKPWGREAIPLMNELGLIIDVSHLSDGGFWDVCRLSRRPFVASHSNARALTPHSRNLTDPMLRALGDRGGVVGVNFAPAFVDAGSPPVSTIEGVCRHAEHILRVAGEDALALGGDLDGISGVMDLNRVEKTPRLLEALARRGMSERQLEKCAWRNVWRVWQEAVAP
jgi:membrane dipeptidase